MSGIFFFKVHHDAKQNLDKHFFHEYMEEKVRNGTFPS